MTAQTCTG